MQNSLFDFLCSSLIPILRADISAGTAGNVHLILILVTAVGASPNELSVLIFNNLDLAVVAAALAIVALGIKLGIHNIVVNISHNAEYGGDVILHIGNFNVADRTAGRETLEFRLE